MCCSDITLTVDDGDFVAIIGYSGTGKTTLMSLLAGLTAPDSGRVLMNGVAVTSPGPERGLVFQNYSLLPWLTVTENIRLAVDQLHPDWSKSQRAEHVARYVRMVKLTPAAREVSCRVIRRNAPAGESGAHAGDGAESAAA